MRITKNGVVKMRDRLIERKLLQKNSKGHLKTEVAYNSVYRLTKGAYNSVTNRTTKYNDTVQLSGTKSNKETNKDYRGVNNRGNGYKLALAKARMFKSKAL